MNKALILFHLREGSEELTRTVLAVESDPEYDEAEFRIAMAHLYHHLNTAWNAREVDHQRAAELSDEDYHAWQQFPADLAIE
jgi:hypothetical protein